MNEELLKTEKNITVLYLNEKFSINVNSSNDFYSIDNESFSSDHVLSYIIYLVQTNSIYLNDELLLNISLTDKKDLYIDLQYLDNMIKYRTALINYFIGNDLANSLTNNDYESLIEETYEEINNILKTSKTVKEFINYIKPLITKYTYRANLLNNSSKFIL